jgi:hypothetical protein
MAIIDPSARRSATVIASEPSVVAQISEADFLALADRFPTVWRLLSRELSRRLDEQRKFHAEPNEKPILFIGSSSEQLPVADAFARCFPEIGRRSGVGKDGITAPSAHKCKTSKESTYDLICGVAKELGSHAGKRADSKRQCVPTERECHSAGCIAAGTNSSFDCAVWHFHPA